MPLRFDFHLLKSARDTRARIGELKTPHGTIETPIFMPVGTQATVKNQTPGSLKQSGSWVLLANTYHLMLRPGMKVFEKLGGIHRFMNWDRPVLTDSGGYQVFSLASARRIEEEGARFKSYVDGREILLSPESSIEMQKAMGSDIMMAFDECVPSTVPYDRANEAMKRSTRWAKRSLRARGAANQALFGIVQGACFEDLRVQSAHDLAEMDMDGFAIGGLAVGETKAQREDTCEWTVSRLPEDKPRYLMGVGTPLDILEAIHRGIDMFDCILPTALAQRGAVFTSSGKKQLRRSVYKYSENALDSNCVCPTCSQYSEAYLHHLYKADEALGWHLLAHHNLTFYHQLLREIRAKIVEEDFYHYYQVQRKCLGRVDSSTYDEPWPVA